MADLVETLRALLSNDNASRGAAEQRYAALKSQQPGATVSGLLRVLFEPQLELPVREEAAVLLRQCLDKIRAAGSVWSRLAFEPSQQEVMARLLQLLEAEQAGKVRRKVADCAQVLGNQLAEPESGARQQSLHAWPELLPTLLRIVTDGSKDPGVRADALWTVQELAGAIWQVLVASAQQLVQVLHACLADAARPVQSGAASLLCEVLGCIDAKDERRPLLPLLPELFAAVMRLADCEDSEHLKLVLQAMASVSDEVAEVYKDCAASHLLPVLCRVAKSHGDDEARRLALEVLCSVTEGRPRMMAKVPNGLGAILEICVAFVMELDDDVESWAAGEENEGAEDEEPQHHFGAEVVDRICRSMQRMEHFPQTMAILQPAVVALFQKAEWKTVVAGLALLRQIMEYVEDEETLTQVLTMVKAKLRADHPRVRATAWGCLEQLAQDHAEIAMADDWSAQFLPEVLHGLNDACPRVVLACMNAFHHYGEGVEREGLEPFAQPLMESLGPKLQGGAALQREAITCVAVVAGQLQQGFARYYGALMPVLKAIVAGSVHRPEDRVLVGKAFECISLLASAVGAEAFRADAGAILEAMAQAAQAPELLADDPVQEYVLAAAERICSTIREGFLPFVPRLLPTVLGKLRLAPREDDEAAAVLLEDEASSLTMVPGENGEPKMLVTSSSELEDLRHALECVCTFTEKLGQGYAPHVAPTAQALSPVFELSMSEELRDLAFDTWGRLCHCARDAGQTQVVAELVLELLRRILPMLENRCTAPETLKTRADGVAACLREAGPGILDGDRVHQVCQVALNLVTDSFARRSKAGTARGKSRASAADDEDTDDDGDDEEQKEEELRQAACNCMAALMTHHPDLFIAQGLPLYIPLLQNLIQPSRPAGDRRLGLYMASSLSEHLGEKIVAQWPCFVPQVLQDIDSQDPEVRTPACYATSFIARQAAFAPHALQTAQRLAEVVVRARARGRRRSEKAAQMAADNALSALMELLLHQDSAVADARGQLWAAWVAGLPCQEDEAEGIRNSGILVQLVQRQKPEVIGPGGEHVPKLLSVLLDVYRTRMADDVTSWSIGRLLLSVGEAQLEQHAASFTEKQRKKLLRVVRDARRDTA